MIKCPKCFQTDLSIINNTHYMCNNPECERREGKKIQFLITEDKKMEFPFNQIFVNRLKKEFYKSKYLELGTVGNSSI